MEDEVVECPMCGCYNEPMGNLGRTNHYRCRDCGIGYQQEDNPNGDSDVSG